MACKRDQRNEDSGNRAKRHRSGEGEGGEDEIFVLNGTPAVHNEVENDREGTDERGFEYLEHPADILMHAWGRTDEEALAALVEALYGVLTERSAINEVYSYEMEAEGDQEDVLVFNMLQEALFAFQAEPYFVGRRVEISELRRDEENGGRMTGVTVRAWGESFEMGRHMQKNDVKAPTYSNMQIRRENGKVDVYCVVDV